jgi:hypothetical protein
MRGLKLKDLLNAISLTYKTKAIIVKKINNKFLTIDEFDVYSYDIRKLKPYFDCYATLEINDSELYKGFIIRIVKQDDIDCRKCKYATSFCTLGRECYGFNKFELKTESEN